MRRSSPPGLHDLDGLAEALRTLFDRHVEGGKLLRIEAAARTPVDPAVRQDVQQSDLLRKPQLVVERSQRADPPSPEDFADRTI